MLINGTLADHADQLAARLDLPDHPSIPHVAAPAAALGFAQRGDTQRARQIVSRWFGAAAAVVDLDPGDRVLGPGRHRARCPRPRMAARPARTACGRARHRWGGRGLRGSRQQPAGRARLASGPATRPPSAPGPAWRWRPASAPPYGSPGPKISLTGSVPRRERPLTGSAINAGLGCLPQACGESVSQPRLLSVMA